MAVQALRQAQDERGERAGKGSPLRAGPADDASGMSVAGSRDGDRLKPVLLDGRVAPTVRATG